MIRAGLLTRGELAQALAGGPVRGGALIAALVDGGLPEESLVGFFVAEGAAPQASAEALGAPDPALVRLVPRALAEALCALPLRHAADGVVAAFADPTDGHARAELARALGVSVSPETARLSTLRDAIREAFARLDEDAASIDVVVDLEGFFDDEPPVALVRRRTSFPAPAASFPPTPSIDDDLHVPLVRTKSIAVPPAVAMPFVGGAPSGSAPCKDAPRPRIQTRGLERPGSEVPRTAVTVGDARAPIATVPLIPLGPVTSGTAAVPAASSAGRADDLWSTLPPATTRASRPPATSDGTASQSETATLPGHPAPVAPDALADDLGDALPDVAPLLAALRSAPTRDEAVRLACEAALPACRCVVFLALKRDVLQGRDVRGGGVSREAVFNLWIPVKSASVFREAIARGVPHLGPYGSSSADAIYKVAVGSDGGDALVQPVLVAGKAIAVLCGDGMRHGARGVRRVEALAGALGDAFERLILHKKA